ncbi:MAG: heme exporter protein CcmD [Beijerinckiaceae bacterium]|jgi:heme exporter protein CcmD
MSAHGWFVLAAYAAAIVAIGGVALAIILDHRALNAALARLPDSDEEGAA